MDRSSQDNLTRVTHERWKDERALQPTLPVSTEPTSPALSLPSSPADQSVACAPGTCSQVSARPSHLVWPTNITPAGAWSVTPGSCAGSPRGSWSASPAESCCASPFQQRRSTRVSPDEDRTSSSEISGVFVEARFGRDRSSSDPGTWPALLATASSPSKNEDEAAPAPSWPPTAAASLPLRGSADEAPRAHSCGTAAPPAAQRQAMDGSGRVHSSSLQNCLHNLTLGRCLQQFSASHDFIPEGLRAMVPLPRGHAMNKDLDLYPLEYDQEPEPVNTGRQGQVFVSRHRASGLRCAAKVVSLSRQNVAALHNEVRIMRRLRHPSIVSLWCVFAGPERCIMVQELCTGGDLLTHLAGARRYSEGEARGVVRAVVDALSYCHHRGVAHLDVKPENLLLASSASGARLKLADWGVAQLVPRGRRLRSPVGTAGYTAPEVLAVPRLNPRGYNQAADIWSLGAVAHLLLCGALPYHVPAGSSFAQELVIVRRRRPVVSSRREWEGVSRQARDFVERALEVDPDKRWSAPDLARHPWFSVDALAPGHGPDLLEAQAKLRQASLRLRGAVRTGIAIGRIQRSRREQQSLQASGEGNGSRSSSDTGIMAPSGMDTASLAADDA